MRIPLTTCLLLTLGLTHPVNMLISAAPGEEIVFDQDGSGSGSESESESESGSGDWSDLGETANNGEPTDINSRMLDSSLWPKKDSEEGYVILENSKSYSLDKPLVAAIIGGSLVGVMLSAIVFSLVIYVRRNKDIGGCCLGKTEQVI